MSKVKLEFYKAGTPNLLRSEIRHMEGIPRQGEMIEYEADTLGLVRNPAIWLAEGIPFVRVYVVTDEGNDKKSD